MLGFFMPETIIQATDFDNRSDIESYIAAEYGYDINKNLDLDVIIEGKRDDLKRLYLTDKSRLWGIRCRILDTPTREKVKKGNAKKRLSNN